MIFPASCVGCGAELEQAKTSEAEVDQSTPPTDQAISVSTFSFMRWQQDHWCDECWRNLSQRSDLVCGKCGARLFQSSPYPEGCALCHGQDIRFDKALALGNYQGLLQELVIRMKNQHDEAVAVQLGKLLGYQLISDGVVEFDQVVAVPTHWWRRLKRGFCAAELIGSSLSDLIGIQFSTNIVHAIRPTKKQGTLSTQARFSNVRGAFAINARIKLTGQRFLLVDDVMTSGATTSEVARILKRKGAAEVYVAVVARGARVS
jgi:ComF family protein